MNSKTQNQTADARVAANKQHSDDVLENYIRISADSIGELRKSDVYRVLNSVRADNIDGVTRGDLATFIARKRPELVAEVTDVMQEDFPSDGWTVSSKEVQAEPAAVGGRPASRLWFAMVDHREIAGTQSFLIAQPAKPSDKEIFQRCSGETNTRKLHVTGLFDLSHVLGTDKGSRDALEQYLRSAEPDAKSSTDGASAKVPGIFDTMVPWGLNRSPICR